MRGLLVSMGLSHCIVKIPAGEISRSCLRGDKELELVPSVVSGAVLERFSCWYLLERKRAEIYRREQSASESLQILHENSERSKQAYKSVLGSIVQARFRAQTESEKT